MNIETRLRRLAVGLVCVMWSAATVNAATLFDNGPPVFPEELIAVGASFSVTADNFVLAEDSVLTGAEIYVWTSGSTAGPPIRWSEHVEWWIFDNLPGQHGAVDFPHDVLSSGEGVNIVSELFAEVRTISGAGDKDGWRATFDFDFPPALAGGQQHWLALHLSESFSEDGTPGSGTEAWVGTLNPENHRLGAKASSNGTFDNWVDIALELSFRLFGTGLGPACDFDNNLACDIVDVDMLVNEIVASTNDPAFDLSADGAVNNADLSQWLGDAATENGFNAPYLLGDANLDGTVDSADLNNLALSWRHDIALWSAGDFTANGYIDSADLNSVALNWRESIPSATLQTAAIPEPSTAAMATLALAAVACLRRRTLGT